mmetsp:Transcript_11687/g.27465  ORF Transcript_11687/g.27465 Transcript_11687/m.27465 type:complete len:206 (-) Transcript_11687:107-724(-)
MPREHGGVQRGRHHVPRQHHARLSWARRRVDQGTVGGSRGHAGEEAYQVHLRLQLQPEAARHGHRHGRHGAVHQPAALRRGLQRLLRRQRGLRPRGEPQARHPGAGLVTAAQGAVRRGQGGVCGDRQGVRQERGAGRPPFPRGPGCGLHHADQDPLPLRGGPRHLRLQAQRAGDRTPLLLLSARSVPLPPTESCIREKPPRCRDP